MKLDRETLIDEISLRYVISHTATDLADKLEKIFGEIASTSYGVEDIADVYEIDITSTPRSKDELLSLIEMRVLEVPYALIEEFEDILIGDTGILELCKTYDSFRIGENREFLSELYHIEMRIREIYTVLARLQGADLKNSEVKLLREYRDEQERFRERLMNEFFFIGFSDYKNVDRRKQAGTKDLMASLGDVKRVKDIGNTVLELSHPTLRLGERFDKLSRVPEVIGKLENLRNNIAHNRYISRKNIENFETAQDIIDEIYEHFLTRFRNDEI